MNAQQLKHAREWRRTGYTFQHIAERLGVDRAQVMAALADGAPRGDHLKEAADEMRRQGYSEEVIAANFGEVAK